MIKDPEKPTEEPFLSRWSRRKQDRDKVIEPSERNEQGREAPDSQLSTVEASDQPDDSVSAATEIDRAESETPVLTDADMPPIESLNENSDYSGFMSPGVSSQLRKLALRKLFAGAGFNIRDGLDDYDEDFTSFEPLGDLVTSDMKHQAEMAEKRKREAEEKAAEARELQSTEEEIETVSEDSQIESVDEQEKVELSDEPQPTLSQEADADEQDLTAENNKQPVSKNQS
jgi:hypothetical protein